SHAATAAGRASSRVATRSNAPMADPGSTLFGPTWPREKPRLRCDREVTLQRAGSGMRFDVAVLGAGMIGVCVALHLQKRGRAVALIDRRGPAEETSFGNAGLIQREAVFPHAFPRELESLLRYARNRSVDASYHLAALPRIAPFLWRYRRHSSP